MSDFTLCMIRAYHNRLPSAVLSKQTTNYTAKTRKNKRRDGNDMHGSGALKQRSDHP